MYPWVLSCRVSGYIRLVLYKGIGNGPYHNEKRLISMIKRDLLWLYYIEHKVSNVINIFITFLSPAT